MKKIMNAKGQFLREEPMTEEEAAKYSGDLFIVDVSDGTVICDYCDKDYTTSKESGGFTLGTHAVCPDCAPRVEANAIKYNETQYIRHRCPEGMLYADWVRDVLRKQHQKETQREIRIKEATNIDRTLVVEECPSCEGLGFEHNELVPEDEQKPCPRCKGTGELIEGIERDWCGGCGGTGIEPGEMWKQCQVCEGEGAMFIEPDEEAAQ